MALGLIAIAILAVSIISILPLVPSTYAEDLPFDDASDGGGGGDGGDYFLMPQEAQRAAAMASMLTGLGYHELAMSFPAYLSTAAYQSSGFLSGPLTIFAPSDDSLEACGGECQPQDILADHLVPGTFSFSNLTSLAFDTKLRTVAEGRCLTLTTTAARLFGSSDADFGDGGSDQPRIPKFFVDGVEIARPDIYDDGRIVVHGLRGFVSPLGPSSCEENNTEYVSQMYRPHFAPKLIGVDARAAMPLMLADAMVELRGSGFSILAIALRTKFMELVSLSNMTVFALDDDAIFSGVGVPYINAVRLHLVPDKLLSHGDLVGLPTATLLPTLMRGQQLVVTHPSASSAVRINFVELKQPDFFTNSRIAVHVVSRPFTQLYIFNSTEGGSGAGEGGEMFGDAAWGGTAAENRYGSCIAPDGFDCAAGVPNTTPPPGSIDVGF